jgi:hypothetical protein
MPETTAEDVVICERVRKVWIFALGSRERGGGGSLCAILPNERSDICFAFAHQEIESGFKIFSGRGQDMMEDRLFVRQALMDVMKDAAVACVVRQCVVYCPADILHDLEFVDTPGTGTDDPLQWRQLTDALASANGIMVVMQRNLEANADLKEELVASGVLRRVIAAQNHCPLVIFSAVDEKSAFITAQKFLARASTHQEKSAAGA